MTLTKVLVGAALGTGVLALSAMNVSAAIVCSGNTCWHTHETYHYPSSAHIVIHQDDWHAGPRVVFREHEGRGYWRGDDSVDIDR